MVVSRNFGWFLRILPAVPPGCRLTCPVCLRTLVDGLPGQAAVPATHLAFEAANSSAARFPNQKIVMGA